MADSTEQAEPSAGPPALHGTTEKAWWALALSMVPCCPLLPMTALGMASTVLGQRHQGREVSDRDYGLAIAATALAAVMLLINVVSIVIFIVRRWPE